jgi:hypothetical protein
MSVRGGIDGTEGFVSADGWDSVGSGRSGAYNDDFRSSRGNPDRCARSLTISPRRRLISFWKSMCRAIRRSKRSSSSFIF